MGTRATYASFAGLRRIIVDGTALPTSKDELKRNESKYSTMILFRGLLTGTGVRERQSETPHWIKPILLNPVRRREVFARCRGELIPRAVAGRGGKIHHV